VFRPSHLRHFGRKSAPPLVVADQEEKEEAVFHTHEEVKFEVRNRSLPPIMGKKLDTNWATPVDLASRLSHLCRPNQRCFVCRKDVLAFDSQVENVPQFGDVIHQACLRCCVCDRELTIKTYHSYESELCCASHLKVIMGIRPPSEDEEEERVE
jgi:uncharacterized CHY-type Zn-finger protein